MPDARILWPYGDTSSRQHYGYLAEKLGCDLNLDRPFLICLRGVEPGAPATHPNVVDYHYRDTGILLFRGGERVFPMSSIPYQTDSKNSPDVNGDGRGDVACVAPGSYVFRDLGKSAGPYPVFAVTNPDGTGKLKCTRDLNHDGQLDHDGDAIYECDQILIHTGIDGLKLTPPSAHTYSIGCSTMSLPWLLLLRERCAATGSGTGRYVIERAEKAIEIMRESPFYSEPGTLA
jgi:hypothetical protein